LASHYTHMKLVLKELPLTGDDLNSYRQIFSVITSEKCEGGWYIHVIEYVKDLKMLTFDRYDIEAVIDDDGILANYSKKRKYELPFADEDTPDIIFKDTEKGRIFLNEGEDEPLLPVWELVDGLTVNSV